MVLSDALISVTPDITPRTSSFANGLVVPIPTSALEVTTKTLPSLECPKVFATPIWNFCSGLSVPIPTFLSTIKSSVNFPYLAKISSR